MLALLSGCGDGPTADPPGSTQTTQSAPTAPTTSTTSTTELAPASTSTTGPDEFDGTLAWGPEGFGPVTWGASIDDAQVALTGLVDDLSVTRGKPTTCPGVLSRIDIPGAALDFVDDEFEGFLVHTPAYPSIWGFTLADTVGTLRATAPEIQISLETHEWYHGDPHDVDGTDPLLVGGIWGGDDDDALGSQVRGRRAAPPPPCPE